MDLPEQLKDSLSVYNFHRGIRVFLIHLEFFLGRAILDKSMKIGFIFFGAKNIFITCFQSLTSFLDFLKQFGKAFTPVELHVHRSYTQGWLGRLTCGAMGP